MRFFPLLLFVSLAFASPIPVIERSLNSILLAIETMIPAIGGTITAVSGLITNTEVALAALTGTSTTYNDLSGPCKKMTVIFARGVSHGPKILFKFLLNIHRLQIQGM